MVRYGITLENSWFESGKEPGSPQTTPYEQRQSLKSKIESIKPGTISQLNDSLSGIKVNGLQGSPYAKLDGLFVYSVEQKIKIGTIEDLEVKKKKKKLEEIAESLKSD